MQINIQQVIGMSTEEHSANFQICIRNLWNSTP